MYCSIPAIESKAWENQGNVLHICNSTVNAVKSEQKVSVSPLIRAEGYLGRHYHTNEHLALALVVRLVSEGYTFAGFPSGPAQTEPSDSDTDDEDKVCC